MNRIPSVSKVFNSFTTSASLVLLASACQAEEAGDPWNVVDQPTSLRAANCPTNWGCTGNSPIVGHMGLHELSLDQIPEENTGLYITGFRKGAKSYVLDKVGTRIVARHPLTKLIALEHEALEGGRITLRSKDPSLADQEFHLSIADVNPTGTTYWRGPADTVETYRITYHIASISHPRDRRGPFELCPNPNPSSDPDAGKMGIYDAVFFGGDRYDAATKTVDPDAASDGNWLNIGCAGGVLAKLLLQRHAPPGFNGAIAPDWQRRQTLMNLYTANYCGTGKSFTFAGEPLAFVTREEGSNAFAVPVGSYESFWGPNGVICLEVPRLQTTQHPWTGDLLGDIESDCGGQLPPLCSSLPGWFNPLKDFGSAEMLSANPSGS